MLICNKFMIHFNYHLFKDIRSKTIGLEKTRASLLCDVGQLEDEERCLQEYRRELELLQQEKMAHVEELRYRHL